MYVDGRDYYECFFIFRLARFNMGYEVYYPPIEKTEEEEGEDDESPNNANSYHGSTKSNGQVAKSAQDDGGWRIIRPSW
jgi:hypothetical protein